jgi:hypothetical protein
MAKPAKTAGAKTGKTDTSKSGADDKRFACPFCTASPCVCPTGTGGAR